MTEPIDDWDLELNNWKCSFCGAYLGRRPSQGEWISFYRVVYTMGHDWDVVRLSSPRKRDVDDDDLPIAVAGETGQGLVLERTEPVFDDDFVPWGQVPSDYPDAYPFGFAFHQVCWEIFERASGLSLDLPVLMRTLRSFGAREGLVTWGHDYGGLLRSPKLPLTRATKYFENYSPDILAVSDNNPFDISWIRKCVESCLRPGFDILSVSLELQQPYPSEATTSSLSPHQLDTFSRLPVDILELLLYYLSSNDVGSLRQSSRTFANMHLSQSFWRSRFDRTHEFGLLFEARGRIIQDGLSHLDWEKLYMRVRSQRFQQGGYGAAYTNRARIWNSAILPVVEIMSALTGIPLQGQPRKTTYEPDLPCTGGAYKMGAHEADGVTYYSLWSPRLMKFEDPSYYIREVFLRRQPLHTVSAFFIRCFGCEYLTGLRFHFDEEAPICLGWILDVGHRRSLPVELVATRRSARLRGVVLSETSNFLGFHIATDRQGIRAIAVATRSHPKISRRTRWAGQQIGNSYASAVLEKPIVSVKAHFDGIKMLALGVSRDKASKYNVSVLRPGLADFYVATAKLTWYNFVREPNYFVTNKFDEHMISEIHTDSLEDATQAVWVNAFRDAFPRHLGYYTAVQPSQATRRGRAEGELSKVGDLDRVDAIVQRYGKADDTGGEQIVIWGFLLLECKRAELSDKRVEWTKAQIQLKNYLIQEYENQMARYEWKEGEAPHSFWGIVAIGKRAQLYNFRPKDGGGLRKIANSGQKDISTGQDQRYLSDFLKCCRELIEREWTDYITPR